MSMHDDLDRPDHSTAQGPVVVRIGAHNDLLALVAAGLGFHPTDSMALLAMDGPRVLTAIRADLPGVDADASRVSAAAEVVLAPAVTRGATDVALVGYGPAETVERVLVHLLELLAGAPIGVLDVVRVNDGRYYCYLCKGEACNPPGGVAFDTTASAVAAQTVVAGMVVFPDRAAVADTIAPVTGEHLDRMRNATNRAVKHIMRAVDRDGLRATARAGSAIVSEAQERYRAGGQLDDDEMARLLVHLINADVRATAWEGTDDEPWQEALWRDATRRATGTLVAAPASLLAFTAWRRGFGALARIAVTRALAADPSFQMASLMRDVLDAGLPPSTFPGWAALSEDMD